MNTGHPRDVDPSITGQPHQVTGKVPDLMGEISRTLGNSAVMPAAVRVLVPPQPCVDSRAESIRMTFLRKLSRAWRLPPPRDAYAAPRCSASHTAVDSRAPSSTAVAQWAIQADMPSGVPET